MNIKRLEMISPSLIEPPSTLPGPVAGVAVPCADSVVDFEGFSTDQGVTFGINFSMDVGKTAAIKLIPSTAFKTFGERINGMNVTGQHGSSDRADVARGYRTTGNFQQTVSFGKQEITLSRCKGDFGSSAIKVASNGVDSVFYFYGDQPGYANGKEQYQLKGLEIPGSQPWYVNVRILERAEPSGTLNFSLRLADPTNLFFDRSKVDSKPVQSNQTVRKQKSFPNLGSTPNLDYYVAEGSSLALEFPGDYPGNPGLADSYKANCPVALVNSVCPIFNPSKPFQETSAGAGLVFFAGAPETKGDLHFTVSPYRGDFSTGAEFIDPGIVRSGSARITHDLDFVVRNLGNSPMSYFVKPGIEKFYLNLRCLKGGLVSSQPLGDFPYCHFKWSLSAHGNWLHLSSAYFTSWDTANITEPNRFIEGPFDQFEVP